MSTRPPPKSATPRATGSGQVGIGRGWAAVGGLPGLYLRYGRTRGAGPPRVEVGPRPDNPSPVPPITDLPARRRDAEVQVAGAGLTGGAHQADLLPGRDPNAGRHRVEDHREVPPVVPDPVVT